MVAPGRKMGPKSLILLLQPRNHWVMVAHGCGWLRGMVAGYSRATIEIQKNGTSLSGISSSIF
jgi:hypothetical protein